MVLISEIHFDPSVFFCFLFSLVTTSRYETPIMYFFLNGGKRPGTRLSARAKTIEPGEGKSIARLAPLAFFFFFAVSLCFLASAPVRHLIPGYGGTSRLSTLESRLCV